MSMTPLERIGRDVFALRSWVADRIMDLSWHVRPVSRRELYISPGFRHALSRFEGFAEDDYGPGYSLLDFVEGDPVDQNP